jgi:hypothetical protein
MKTKITFIICYILTFLFYDSGAQKTTSSSGGIITGKGGSISYSVGQVTKFYLNETKGSVAQGVQQPFEIYLITGIVQTR